MEEYNSNKIKSITSNCKILKLEIENVDIFRFNITSKDQLDLFSFGYQEYKNNI